MKLTYHSEPGRPAYWYAITDNGGYDGDGPDPLAAVCNLVAQIERELLGR